MPSDIVNVDTVGQRLKKARCDQSFEISKVAEATKIRPEQIEDLEADDYAHFPNPTYAKCFLAKYARYLGVDIGDELDRFKVGSSVSLKEYRYLTYTPMPNNASIKRNFSPRGFRVPPLVIVGLVAAILIGVPAISYFSLSLSRPNSVPSSTPEAQDKLALESPTLSPVLTAKSLEQHVQTLAREENRPTPRPGDIDPPGQLAPSPSPVPTDVVTESKNSSPNDSAVAVPDSLPSADQAEKTLEVKVLRKTWVQVKRDEKKNKPVFEGVTGPHSSPIVVAGKRFWVRVRDKRAIEVRKDGQLVVGTSGDVVIN
ncbi:MAG: helix-turn-helix domain-containing protein [Verrucomicrobia bacterium]|nr:helix-turn-helix domain-containing protein [Verrucomicrobiota bacterium]